MGSCRCPSLKGGRKSRSQDGSTKTKSFQIQEDGRMRGGHHP
jgi:hypothetical protein